MKEKSNKLEEETSYKKFIKNDIATFAKDANVLRTLIRYQNCNRLVNESVAEHSFYVALIALELCDKYNIDEERTFKCLVKALLHDMPEIKLNDITHDVKEALGLRPMLKKYEDDFYKLEYPEYADLMTNNKDELVDKIVELADVLSVYQYTSNEIELGNQSNDIQDIYTDTVSRIIKLGGEL